MGTLDNTDGAQVNRKIKFVDVTPYNPTQIETYFNDNYGNKGWEIKQVVVIGANKYLLAEKQY